MEQTPEEFRKNVKKWLVINRIPEKTREEFVNTANDLFCGDYGMLLREVWEQYKEYQWMKSQIFSDIRLQLAYIEDKLEGINTNKEDLPSANLTTEEIISRKKKEIEKRREEHGKD